MLSTGPSTQLAPYAAAGLAGLPSAFGELAGQDQQGAISYNCHETSDAVVYIFDVPGVSKSDVVVQVLPPSDGHARHRLNVRVSRHAPKVEHGSTSWHEGRVSVGGGRRALLSPSQRALPCAHPIVPYRGGGPLPPQRLLPLMPCLPTSLLSPPLPPILPPPVDGDANPNGAAAHVG